MFVSRTPLPPLSELVCTLWYASDWKPAHRRERVMPDGTAGVVISLDSRFAIVTGPRSRSIVVGTAESPDTIIGAQFTHGGAAAFFDVPISELWNTHAPLDDVGGAELRERLLALPAAADRLDFLEGWLRDRFLRRTRPDPAILWAVRELRRPQTRVADVSAQIGRSSRWFIDRFAGVVGLTPKVFNRVQRFQAALRAIPQYSSLADLAVSAGYYDQAHLIHEFHALAGMSPSALLAGRTEFLNHVVDRD